jgi:uncharacterized protein with HEPN domain
MLEYARKGVELLRDHARAEIQTNLLLQLALPHLILIVGEAAARVSPAGRALHPDIPWAKAIGARNFVAHGYDRIDYEVVWETIEEHFPSLVASLERALSSEPG